MPSGTKNDFLPSLALLNGKIYTVDDNLSWAQAVLIVDNKIAAVGTTSQIKDRLSPRTEIIDLQGKLVLPGFNDAHLHFSDGAFALRGVQLRDCQDEADFASRIQKYVQRQPPGTWIIEGNWDHENWPHQQYPSRQLIDPFTQQHPVFLSRLDYHVALANSLALKLAGIDRDTPAPAGGEILKDAATGEPTGILKDKAWDLIFKVIPPYSFEQKKAAFVTGLAHAAQLGVTSFQDNMCQLDFLVYQNLLQENRLTARVSGWLPISELNFLQQIGIRAGFGDEKLRLGTLKIFVDGSMGAGSALFFQPYHDDPRTSGLAVTSEQELAQQIAAANTAGLQLAIHAIGDKANYIVLHTLEQNNAGNPHNRLRHRIEHAQVVRPEDLSLFSTTGAIASIQPSHLSDDQVWAEKRIGFARCQNAYRVNSFFENNIPVALGTDWPVESLNPLLGIYAAVTRQTVSGRPTDGWFPKEKISLAQAIFSYTRGSAFAEFAEHKKGSLAVGKLADLVVLSKDLFTIPAEEILTSEITHTIFDGKLIYQKE